MYDHESEEQFRNATPTPQDHRVVVHPSPFSPQQHPGAQQVHVLPVHPSAYAPTYPVPSPYGQHPYPQHPYPQHPYPQHPGELGMMGHPGHPGHPYHSLYQKHQQVKVLKTIGVVVDVLGQAIAAIMPVPAAPTIIGVTATDDENMKRYQQALANHAKTDERIRTVAKVVRETLNTVKQL